jgi:deazaflavin-dependent oxidoreductase (nitroreductase family)
MPTPPPMPPPGSLQLKVVNVMTELNTRAYRLSGGRIGGRFKGAPVLLLEHVGRKSGKRRTSPLLYLRDGEDLVLVASAGGREAHPAWFYNVMASPRNTVQVGRERREVLARKATPEERARLWPQVVAIYADYDAYQRRTSREIPLVILSPA